MRMRRWAGYVAHTRYIGNVYKILVGKPERKRSLGRLRRRLEDDNIMNRKGIGLGCGLDSCASG
jgi:hypothetical protein